MKRFVDESGSLREQILKLEELLLSKNNILQVWMIRFQIMFLLRNCASCKYPIDSPNNSKQLEAYFDNGSSYS